MTNSRDSGNSLGEHPYLHWNLQLGWTCYKLFWCWWMLVLLEGEQQVYFMQHSLPGTQLAPWQNNTWVPSYLAHHDILCSYGRYVVLKWFNEISRRNYLFDMPDEFVFSEVIYYEQEHVAFSVKQFICKEISLREGHIVFSVKHRTSSPKPKRLVPLSVFLTYFHSGYDVSSVSSVFDQYSTIMNAL